MNNFPRTINEASEFDFNYPCKHGHQYCAIKEGGNCSDEMHLVDQGCQQAEEIQYLEAWDEAHMIQAGIAQAEETEKPKGYGTIKETPNGHTIKLRLGDLEKTGTSDGGYFCAHQCAVDWFEENGADDWEVEDITYSN